MPNPEQILNTYLHVQDGGRIDTVPAPESFWKDLAEGKHPQLDQGRLVSAGTFNASWPTWERHPAGEELVMLLSGTVTLLLEDADSVREVALTAPGDYVLIPPNTWHTARTQVPATLLFLTPGAGTEHRPVAA